MTAKDAMEALEKCATALETYINNEWAYAKVSHAAASRAEEMLVVGNARQALTRLQEVEQERDLLQAASNAYHEDNRKLLAKNIELEKQADALAGALSIARRDLFNWVAQEDARDSAVACADKYLTSYSAFKGRG